MTVTNIKKQTGLASENSETPLNIGELFKKGSSANDWHTRTVSYLQLLKLVEEAITETYPDISINEALFRHANTLNQENSCLEIALQDDSPLNTYKFCLSDVFKTFSGIESGHLSHYVEDFEDHGKAIQLAERIAHIGILVEDQSFKETIFESMIKLAHKLNDTKQKESLARISLILAGKISKHPENMEKFKHIAEVKSLSKTYKKDQWDRISNSTIQFLNIINAALDGKVENLANKSRGLNNDTLMPPNSFFKFKAPN